MSLIKKGVDVIAAIRAEVQERVTENGSTARADEKFVVLLLHIPIVREIGTEPERTTRRAFLLMTGALKLGQRINALFFLDGKYFKDVMGQIDNDPQAPWRSQQVLSTEVQRLNTVEAARFQSGLSEIGPEGVLVGAGSLGSAMLNIWGRSGWGKWTVIDHDHIKPHNLARHVALAQHIGAPKVDVVAHLHAAVAHGASEVVPIYADACNVSDARVRGSIEKATLVVDVSTTLDYPRLVSKIDGLGRHMSAFVTPDGRSAVLLAEDEGRTIRLRTLEAQYYRAIIQEPWGEGHLGEDQRTFWSGASCRDISSIMPYSRILVHAATLAEQAQSANRVPAALIRLWSRNPDSGSVAVHSVNAFPETRRPFDDLDLFMDEGLEARLRAMREKESPKETGGVLLGYYDFNVKAVVIVEALPAPADSKASSAWFERGVEGLAGAVAEASKRTAGVVRYVGEWHSHPPGHSAAPSQDDMFQLVYLALGMDQDGLPAVSLIVGESDIQVMQAVVRG